MVAVLTALCIAVTGCGSGSGNTSARLSKTTCKLAPKQLQGETLGAIELTLSIPYGVTVQLDPLTNQPAKNVVQLVGGNNPPIVYQGNQYSVVYDAVDYLAPTPTALGYLKFKIINVNGFGPLEEIAIELQLTDGIPLPDKNAFLVSDFNVYGFVTYGKISIPNFIPVVNYL